MNHSNQAVVLEGFHAVKHALRFAPELVREVLAVNHEWRELTDSLAPDIRAELERRVKLVSERDILAWSRSIHPTGMMALAPRPEYTVDPRLGKYRSTPAVLLDEPRRPGNAGAVIRVAAGAEASGVLMTGPLDPWQPAVVRGAAGLQYALPVLAVSELADLEGPLIGFEADGRDIREVTIPPQAVLAFGTEREGLSPQLRETCDQVVALPMRPGVSSLNLATSVAAALYYLTLRPYS
jgi:RNA methyltransferase, TrmH family